MIMTKVNRHQYWSHENWEEPYKSAWKVAIAPGDAIVEGGSANKKKLRTVQNNEWAFGRYEEFLRNNSLCDTGVVPELDNLRAYAAHLLNTVAPYTVLAQMTQLTGALRLMFPDADLSQLIPSR
jgi:hypothetical protein